MDQGEDEGRDIEWYDQEIALEEARKKGRRWQQGVSEHDKLMADGHSAGRVRDLEEKRVAAGCGRFAWAGLGLGIAILTAIGVIVVRRGGDDAEPVTERPVVAVSTVAPTVAETGSPNCKPAAGGNSRPCPPATIAETGGPEVIAETSAPPTTTAIAITSTPSTVTADTTPPPTAAPAAGGAPVVVGGSSGGPVGCVPCTGQARFIPVQSPPGPGSFPGVDGQTQASVDLQPGTYRNLRIDVDRADRGRWNMNLGAVQLGCVLQPGDRFCVSEGPFELTEPGLVALFVGNDGDPNIYGDPTGITNPNGSRIPLVHPETDGAFVMTFTFEFMPAV